MSETNNTVNARILVVDDNPNILDDFRKILCPVPATSHDLAELERQLFGQPQSSSSPQYELLCCQSGQLAYELAEQALQEQHPIQVAFIDMRMPNGWNGLKTASELWRLDPCIQLVICTAYADYSWQEITNTLGVSDRLLILRKPFDKIEVQQLACALSHKWVLQRQQQQTEADLRHNISARSAQLIQARYEQYQAEQQIQRLFELSPDFICVLDQQLNLQAFNPSLAKLNRLLTPPGAGQAFIQLLHPKERDSMRTWLLHLSQQSEAQVQVVSMHTQTPLFIEWRFIPLSEEGQVFAYGRDLSHHLAAEHNKKRLSAVLEGTSDIVFFADPQGRILYLNPRAALLFGQSSPPNALQQLLSPAAASHFLTHALPEALETGSWQGESELLTSAGKQLPVSLVLQAHSDHQQRLEFISAIMRDISEQKAYEMRLQRQASYDSLTGLPNRNLLYEVLEKQIQLYPEQPLSILFLDVDRFKMVNDSLGHHCGDQLLCQLAERLYRGIERKDLAARLSGDEFIVVRQGVSDAEQALTQAEQLRLQITEPVELDGLPVFINCSIGVSLYPQDGEDIDTLLRHADTALNRAKEQGRGLCKLFTPSMSAEAERRMELISELAQALTQEQLSLHFQPQWDLNPLRIQGFEALLRWHHPKLGPISPADFIPLAEENGLIIPMGRWVLQQACQFICQLEREGYGQFSIAVNLSTREYIQADLLDVLRSTLEHSGLGPGRLELEITESQLIRDMQGAAEILGNIRQLGIQLALDDFGTGYSCLSYLQHLPLNRLKIDKSFIHDLSFDQGDRAITRSIINLAHNLGLKVVGEGVETEQQLDFLQQYQCDQAQGFLLAKPMPASAIYQLLQQQQKQHA
ncbi:EAL domain-containing protein [Balneatrix alpica]|uniref:EAL domain-containing protein n=1 Tax=Balneatrix alpica TaxID=75684 RepID=UPI0027387B3D|nr:EAL domain-containing protein [Balneatrix alpica]